MERTLHSPEGQEISRCVKALRTRAGLTQAALAKLAGICRTEITRMESRERGVDLVKLHRICGACGVDPSRVARELFRAFDRIRAAKK